MSRFHGNFLRFVFLAASLLGLTHSCLDHAVDVGDAATLAANHAQRRAAQAGQKTAIYNVRVFDGQRILPPSLVVINGDKIGTFADLVGAEFIDGQGDVLLPGFIDTHCHPRSIDDLNEQSSYGITTAFLQSGSSPAVRASLTNHPGVTDLRFASVQAVATNDSSVVPPIIVQSGGFISKPEQAAPFVQAQAPTADWIKILAVSPNIPDVVQPVLNALVNSSQVFGKQTICHAPAYESVRQALTAGVSQLHHSPLDKAVDAPLAARYRLGRQPNCPTLVAMQAITDRNPGRGLNYTAAQESVRQLYKAGVSILAGTDSTTQAGIPFVVPFGDSFHLELQFLVEAGLSPLDALRAGTVLPAQYYGLTDRGSIRPGLRADLVLVGGNPLRNISNTRDIKRVWVGGVPHAVNTTTTLTREGLAAFNPPN